MEKILIIQYFNLRIVPNNLKLASLQSDWTISFLIYHQIESKTVSTGYIHFPLNTILQKSADTRKKTTTSQTHFGFTNMGSEMLQFRGRAIWNNGFWFGSPCKPLTPKIRLTQNTSYVLNWLKVTYCVLNEMRKKVFHVISFIHIGSWYSFLTIWHIYNSGLGLRFLQELQFEHEDKKKCH